MLDRFRSDLEREYAEKIKGAAVDNAAC